MNSTRKSINRQKIINYKSKLMLIPKQYYVYSQQPPILSILHVNDAWKKLSSLLWRHTPAGCKLTEEKTYKRRIKERDRRNHPLTFAFVLLIRMIIYNLQNLFEDNMVLSRSRTDLTLWNIRKLCNISI